MNFRPEGMGGQEKMTSLRDFKVGDRVRVLDGGKLLFGTVQTQQSFIRIRVAIDNEDDEPRIKMCHVNEVAKLDEWICVIQSWNYKRNYGTCFIDREFYTEYHLMAKIIPENFWLFQLNGRLDVTPGELLQKMAATLPPRASEVSQQFAVM